MSRFRPNPAFAEEVRKDRSVMRALDAAAVDVKEIAERIAPEGPTGLYHRSFIIIHLSAGRVLVATTDFAGALVEWGSINNPPYAVLRRAAREAGLRLVELRR